MKSKLLASTVGLAMLGTSALALADNNRGQTAALPTMGAPRSSAPRTLRRTIGRIPGRPWSCTSTGTDRCGALRTTTTTAMRRDPMGAMTTE